jgi:zinc/manganese transport system ATP-binding protein
MVVSGALTHAVASIALDRASFAWRGRSAVRNVSGCFEPGSMTAIIGPNGAGKSTLIKGVMGVLSPASGAVRVTGAARDELAWLPQAGDLDRSFPVTVLDMVAMGAWRRSGAWRRISREEEERTYQALAAVGMAEHAHRIIGTLSGGQMQRALFARLLLQDAHVLLLDEPFTAIDSHTTEDLMRLLCNWHAQGRSVIAVLHDLDLVREHFPQTLLLAGEVVAWGATADVLTRDNLMRARRLHDEAVQ